MKFRILSCLSLCTLVVCASAQADERIGTFTVEIRVKGTQHWAAAQDYADSTLSEYYKVVTHVKSDGEAVSYNPLDPNDAQRQMAKAAAVQRRVNAVLGAHAPERPATQAEYQARQQALAEQAQRDQIACGADTACLMQLAMKYAQATASIETPGLDVDAVDLDAASADQPRYLSYLGYENCPTQIEIRIKRHSKGAYADVAGMIPFTEREEATRSGPDPTNMQCFSQQAIYDLVDQQIHSYGFRPPQARGQSLRTEPYRETRNDDAEISGTIAAMDWVNEQLRHAPASGTRSTTLSSPAQALVGTAGADARFSGTLEVSLSWRFDPG
jgi:Skp family chaperone for outer membrane proteins